MKRKKTGITKERGKKIGKQGKKQDKKGFNLSCLHTGCVIKKTPAPHLVFFGPIFFFVVSFSFCTCLYPDRKG